MLIMAGKFRIASANSTFSGVLQISMTLALVPALGALGAALATAFTVALGHITTLILVKLVTGLWPIPLTFREFRLGIQGRVI
jgi:O-antigen/teichoic acid export membrane protein